MDYNTIAAIVFFVGVIIFSIIKWKKFQIEGKFPFFYTALYKTKLGLKTMDWLANKWPRFWIIFGKVGIFVGFVAMILMTVLILYSLSHMLTAKPTLEAMPAVGLVLPFKIKGTFYVPFTFWIVSLMVVASIHEFAHGIISRLYRIKVKSSGFAFFAILIPLLPAAFVEPDEKIMSKKPRSQQLSVLAAGAFVNVLLGVLLLFTIIPMITAPVGSIMQLDGVAIDHVLSDKHGFNPAKANSLLPGDLIVKIGWVQDESLAVFPIQSLDDFSNALKDRKPGDNIFLTIKRGEDQIDLFDIILGTHPLDKEKGYLGVSVYQSESIRPKIISRYGVVWPNIALWMHNAIYWIMLISLGIGLFNLLPILPLDGGKMMQLLLGRFLPKKKVNILSGAITLLLVGILLFMVVTGFII